MLFLIHLLKRLQLLSCCVFRFPLNPHIAYSNKCFFESINIQYHYYLPCLEWHAFDRSPSIFLRDSPSPRADLEWSAFFEDTNKYTVCRTELMLRCDMAKLPLKLFVYERFCHRAEKNASDKLLAARTPVT